jgi:hypothetical protein
MRVRHNWKTAIGYFGKCDKCGINIESPDTNTTVTYREVKMEDEKGYLIGYNYYCNKCRPKHSETIK